MFGVLNCTPNDLFERRADKDTTIGENHALKREPASPSLSELMREIPIEKLHEMKNVLLKMRDER